MKIDRLLGITIYLLNHNKVTAQRLAEHFEVSIRTILRDIDSLCMAGIPVVSTYGADGGYQISDAFRLERCAAGNTDYSFIITALQGFATAFPSKELTQTLEKLQAASAGTATDVILDFGVLGENTEINKKLTLLDQAIKKKHQVVFTYTNAENQEKKVETEPIAVIYKWYRWYLLSYHPGCQDYRSYKLDRMEQLSISNHKNSLEHNAVHAREQWEQQEDKRTYLQVRLYCKREIKAKCIEYLNGSIEETYDNGDILYRFQVPEKEQFWYGALLSFGNQVQVLEPEELRLRICNTCQEVLQVYVSRE